ncbi:MAG: GyrI-like domain-containing protein [Prolixibacteraceae bacterium]|jgi:effector-binding domain-containing protein|nr:GyrI-like domain-containing protein [Prolixibacteraceae bacterium]
MKTIWKTLLVFIGAVLVLWAASFLLPEKIHIERTATINAPARVIFNQVNDLYCWNKWAPWNQIDPGMEVKYINGGVGQGAGYHWSSDNRQVGNGKLYITRSLAYDSIVVSMDFMQGGLAGGYFLFREDSSKTSVTWAFESHLGNNPLARWMGLMFDQMIGADFEKGLSNLDSLSKSIIEEQRPVVEIVDLPEIVYAGIKKTVKWEDIGNEMGTMYSKISLFLQKNGIQVVDMPFTIYHSMNEGEMEIECGLPVSQAFDPATEVICGKRVAGKYAFAIHVGNYETLETTHAILQKWIAGHSFLVTGGPVEVYLTDPATEPDPGKWVTNIYYPL